MDDKKSEAKTPEIVENTNLVRKSEKTPALHDERGKFAVGHPHLGGRQPGTKNKMTLVKEQLAEACLENDFKKKFSEMLNSDDKNDRKWAMDKAVILAPKETLLDADISVGPRIIIVRAADQDKDIDTK